MWVRPQRPPRPRPRPARARSCEAGGALRPGLRGSARGSPAAAAPRAGLRGPSRPASLLCLPLRPPVRATGPPGTLTPVLGSPDSLPQPPPRATGPPPAPSPPPRTARLPGPAATPLRAPRAVRPPGTPPHAPPRSEGCRTPSSRGADPPGRRGRSPRAAAGGSSPGAWPGRKRGSRSGPGSRGRLDFEPRMELIAISANRSSWGGAGCPRPASTWRRGRKGYRRQRTLFQTQPVRLCQGHRGAAGRPRSTQKPRAVFMTCSQWHKDLISQTRAYRKTGFLVCGVGRLPGTKAGLRWD